MKEQDAKEQIKLRGWAMQIDTCTSSGLPVKRWCKENGIAVKTYYYHVKRVREELLNTPEIANAIKQAGAAGSHGGDGSMRTELAVSDMTHPPSSKGPPVFAALTMPQQKGAAVTVWMGAYAVDIRNGADEAVVGQVLNTVARL
jgi:hypothetical protein